MRRDSTSYAAFVGEVAECIERCDLRDSELRVYLHDVMLEHFATPLSRTDENTIAWLNDAAGNAAERRLVASIIRRIRACQHEEAPPDE